MVRCLLLESSVPPSFWPEALTTATHIINRLPSPKLQNTSPHFRLFKTDPQYTNFHTFGCICFVHLPTLERSKLSAQSAKCVFLGYASHQKGFVCYDPTSKRIRISRNVIFFNINIFCSLMLILLQKSPFLKYHPLMMNVFLHLCDFIRTRCILVDKEQMPLLCLFCKNRSRILLPAPASTSPQLAIRR